MKGLTVFDEDLTDVGISSELHRLTDSGFHVGFVSSLWLALAMAGTGTKHWSLSNDYSQEEAQRAILAGFSGKKENANQYFLLGVPSATGRGLRVVSILRYSVMCNRIRVQNYSTELILRVNDLERSVCVR
jgi:hypothetical protein